MVNKAVQKKKFGAKNRHAGWGMTIMIICLLEFFFTPVILADLVAASDSNSPIGVATIFISMIFWLLGAFWGLWLFLGGRSEIVIENTSSDEFLKPSEYLHAITSAEKDAEKLYWTRKLNIAYFKNNPTKNQFDFDNWFSGKGVPQTINYPQRITEIYDKDRNAFEVFEGFIFYRDNIYYYDHRADVRYSPPGAPYSDQQRASNGVNAPLQISGFGVPATIVMSTKEWSLNVDVADQDYRNAELVASRIQAIISSLRPEAATREDIHSSMSDIRSLVDEIINSKQESTSEKIEKLDQLRYKRLLSDEDFRSSVQKIINNI